MSERADHIKHYWEVGPNPTTPLDNLVRNILEPWNYGWVGETKPHGWEWKREDFPEGYQGTLVPGNPDEMKRARGLIMRYASAIAAENRFKFGWKEVVVLKPDQDLLDPSRNLQWWRYAWSPAWQEFDNAFIETCRINIYPDRAIRAMIGPRDFRVYGVGSDSEEVPLKVTGPFLREETRRDPRYKNIVLF